jgi:hypothetical protein
VKRSTVAVVAVLVFLGVGGVVYTAFNIAVGRPSHVVHWSRPEVLGPRTVQVHYTMPEPSDYKSPSCWRAEPDVSYRESEVGIVLRLEKFADLCTTELGIVSESLVTIELAEDLDGRTLVDGA